MIISVNGNSYHIITTMNYFQRWLLLPVVILISDYYQQWLSLLPTVNFITYTHTIVTYSDCHQQWSSFTWTIDIAGQSRCDCYNQYVLSTLIVRVIYTTIWITPQSTFLPLFIPKNPVNKALDDNSDNTQSDSPIKWQLDTNK